MTPDPAAQAARAQHIEKALLELVGATKELVAMLRHEAPGTPLNNHRFDALGVTVNNAITAAIAALEDAGASEALHHVCAICYHQLDRCSHCDKPAQPSATVDEARAHALRRMHCPERSLGAASVKGDELALDALIAAVRQEPPPQTWQPIASAPKDGTQVLVCRNGELVQQGAWNAGGSMCLPHWMTLGRLFDPTHWMPLPAPPAPEEGK